MRKRKKKSEKQSIDTGNRPNGRAPVKRVAAGRESFLILTTFQVWNWRDDAEHRSDTIFRQFMSDQLEKKIVSSKVPTDEAELDRHIQLMKDDLGLQLTREDFKFNPALRTLGKYLANNL